MYLPEAHLGASVHVVRSGQEIFDVPSNLQAFIHNFKQFVKYIINRL